MSGVKILFAHDTEEALLSAVDLINTVGDDGDELTSPADLDRFVAQWRITGSRTGDAAELDAVRDLRGELRRIWVSDDGDEVVASVNTLLADARAVPQLVRHDDWDWHLHATTPERPLATRIAVEVAMALVDVIRTGELARLQVCDADDCEDVLIDLSRNRSRRYCDGGCANRAHVAAYRARRAALDRKPTESGSMSPG
jgi:predicted RNA-binding Zn ribbon-like protein